MRLYARLSEQGTIELSCATRAWEDWQTLADFDGPSFSPREIPLQDVKVEGVLSLRALTTTERWVSDGFDWVEGLRLIRYVDSFTTPTIVGSWPCCILVNWPSP